MIVFKFYSESCGPCKALTEPLGAACRAHHVEQFTLNVMNTMEVCQEFRIKSVPTVLAFEDGNEIGRFVGFKSEKEISDWLKN